MTHGKPNKRVQTNRIGQVACLLLLLPIAASAQTEAAATIDSVGVATIDVTPDYVEFWLTLRASAASLTESAQSVLPFRDRLTAELEKGQLLPSSVNVSGASIPDANENDVVVSARVRFPISQSSNREDKTQTFAATAQKMRAVGKSLGCTLDGPFLGVEQTEPIEREAVARATENALYKADAVAGLMESPIFEVESVSVLEVVWNREALAPVPTSQDVERITCTGRVKVVYKFAPF